jgi:hypothetical protein
VQLFIRAYDPLTEISMPMFGNRIEDRMWIHTLRAIAAHVGVVDAEVSKQIVLVDKRRQWRYFGNWRTSSALYAATRPFRRKVPVAAGSTPDDT